MGLLPLQNFFLDLQFRPCNSFGVKMKIIYFIFAGVTKKNVAENANRRNNIEIEEGDSGIDANSLGSCSSNDVKATSMERQKDKKNKKSPVLGETSKTVVNPKQRESRSTEKLDETKSNKKKKKKEKEPANVSIKKLI